MNPRRRAEENPSFNENGDQAEPCFFNREVRFRKTMMRKIKPKARNIRLIGLRKKIPGSLSERKRDIPPA